MVTKEEIIDKIQRIDDKSILENLMDLMDLELDLSQKEIKLNEFQKTAIDRGLQDVKEGKIFQMRRPRKWSENGWQRDKVVSSCY